MAMLMTAEGVFARQLRQRRRAIGMTQTKLADALSERLGTRFFDTAVTKIENGQRAIRLDEAVHIADVLGVSLMWLLTEENEVGIRIHELEEEIEHYQSQIRVTQEATEEARGRVRELEETLAHLRADGHG